MEFKRLLTFAVVAMAILMGWNYFFPPPKPPVANQAASQVQAGANGAVGAPAAEAVLAAADLITVHTDTIKAQIDRKSGDLRHLTLLKHNATGDASKDLLLFGDAKDYTYVAQSALLDKQGQFLLKDLPFSSDQTDYRLNGDVLEVKLSAPEVNGIKVDKVYTFKKGAYDIGVRFDVTNLTGSPLNLDAMYRLLRDGSTPEGEGRFTHTYTGPVVYTPTGKFEKVPFKDLDKDLAAGKDEADYVRKTQTGWIGMIQHYFMATWILQPKGGNSVCGPAADGCHLEVKKRSDGLYSAGVRVSVPTIAPDATVAVPMMLYAGPQTYSVITKVADNLQLVKDYGKVHIFSSPLFWLLNKLHEWVGNWGWAIVLLTIIVKAILFPLTAASYRSMAKMRAVAPRLEVLKKEHGDDRMKLQQEMMAMYKKEKINPLGGCLPMLVQIPVFIGLYWALFASVELRQAPWIGWIQDLGRPDPYYILPIIMALSMFLQTHLNPPPADPMQAKMMKIMPVIFSVMFFFFPAGLVLYWVVNNIISIGQQWYINKAIEKKTAKHAAA